MDEKQKEMDEKFYDYYVGKLSRSEVSVMLCDWPSVLQGNKSIYPRRHYYDKTRDVVTVFFKERGISTHFAGPSGLGAPGGGIATAVYYFMMLNSEHIMMFIKSIPWAIKAGKFIYKIAKKRNDRLYELEDRKIAPTIDVHLTKSFTEGNDDTAVYLKQLLFAALDLKDRLSTELAYIQYKFSLCMTINLNDNNLRSSVVVDFGDNISKRNLNKIIKKLNSLELGSQKVTHIQDSKSYMYPLKNKIFFKLVDKMQRHITKFIIWKNERK